MITYVDTNELEEIAKDFQKATNDFEKEIDSLYRRLSNVPTSTREWIGGKANIYFSRVISDKKQYTQLIETMRSIERELFNQAAEIKNRIKANNS